MQPISSWVINSLAASELLSHQQRLAIYKRHGLIFKDGVWIEPRCYFHNGRLENIKLSDRVFIGSHCYFDGTGKIEIGARSAISDHVRIHTTTHADGFPHSASGAVIKDVYIGDNCVIYSGTVILPGAYIGNRVKIASSSLILQDQVIPDDSFYAGIPAREKQRNTVDDRLLNQETRDRN